MDLIYIFVIVNLSYCFKNGCLTERFSYRLFVKNPDFARKQREQRRSKRLKQVLPKEQAMLDRRIDNLVRMSKGLHHRIFGYRLSQVPGDGGKIPNLDYSTEKQHCVKKYFSDYYGNEENYLEYVKNEDQVIDQICKDPYKPFGQYKNEEPLVKKTFYKPFEGYYPLSKFVQGTMKRTISIIKKETPERFKGTQAYCGLQVETLFSGANPEKLNILRQVEIEVKQGGINPNNPFLKVDSKYDFNPEQKQQQQK